MFFINKKNITISILLVTLLFFFYDLTLQKELIFPELGALVVGGFLLDKTPSAHKRTCYFLCPTICAFIGLGISKYSFIPLSLKVGLALMLVITILSVFNSYLYPSVSAAVLPIIMNSKDLIYPISVAFFTLLIALIKIFFDKDYKAYENTKLFKKPVFSITELLNWILIIAVVVIVTALSNHFGYIYIIAPPLIVAFIEMCKHLKQGNQKLLPMVFSLFGFSLFGTICYYFISIKFSLPLFVFAIITMTLSIIFSVHIKFFFPPAFAVMLLPSIIKPSSIPIFPILILIGSSVFALFAILLFTRQKESDVLRKSA